MEQVLNTNEPNLIQLTKSLGLIGAKAVVVLLLTEALEYFNVTSPMSERQTATTVEFIIEEYGYLKMDDVKLCLKNAMKGKYGKVYNRIDGQIVMSWFKAYSMERCAEADRLSFEEHMRHKAELAENSRSTGMFLDEYRKGLQAAAASGDKSAKAKLEASIATETMFKEIRQKKEFDEEGFKKFKEEYLRTGNI